MLKQLTRWLRDEEAVTAAEYAILLGLLVMTVIIAINAVGSTSSGIWANDTNKITSALGG